jgi:hypothetical protein
VRDRRAGGPVDQEAVLEAASLNGNLFARVAPRPREHRLRQAGSG